jgi:F-type H+-transporting ATPase subunit gamma
MLGIREFNRKIKSLKNTAKITGSMKMISSVKLQRFTRLKHAFMPYNESVETMRLRICRLFAESSYPAIGGYKKPSMALVMVVTGNRGLCGQFNANAIREAVQLCGKLSSAKKTCLIGCVGSRGLAFFQKQDISTEQLLKRQVKNIDWEASTEIADALFARFCASELHEIWAVYSRRISVLQEKPVSEMLLPISSGHHADSIGGKTTDYILEEPADKLANIYAGTYIRSAVYRVLLDASLGEHAARMSAMEAASENCDRMIRRYMQLKNRARQTAVTTELNEIVTGKEALES